MNITCPKCQASLQLPEEVEGQEVRCPVCREVFRAEQAKQSGVQTKLPEVLPKRPAPAPVEDDGPPMTKRPPVEDISRPRWPEEEPLSEEEREILLDNAHLQTHLAGMLTVTAAAVTTASLVIEFALHYLQMLDPAQANNGGEVLLLKTMATFCWGVFFIPLVVFAFLGGRSLLQLGSRSLTVTGLTMNYIMALILLLFVGLNVLVGDPFLITYVNIVLDGLSCLLNFSAAIAATKALTQRAVQKFYRYQDQQILERRRY